MFIEYMNEKGVDSSERLMNSLEAFAKLDEFDELEQQFKKIMFHAKEMQKEDEKSRQDVRDQVEKEVSLAKQKHSYLNN